MSLNDLKYLDQPEHWDELASRLRAAGVIGLDTEYFGLNDRDQSCVGRSRIHVWSVAIRTARMDPLGFHHARGWMLPGTALTHPSIKSVLEDESIRKEIHNEPVDKHSARNHGVDLRGCRNTLGYLRWKMPGLVIQPGRFKLKPNMERLLRRSPVCTFAELVSYERTVVVKTVKRVKFKGCSCGVPKCRLRKPSDGLTHDKLEFTQDVEVAREKVEKGKYPLEEIVPGHERWELLTEYSIVDSVAALQFGEICDGTPDPCKFPYTDGPRPAYSQAVEEAIIDLESNGLPVDTEYCREKAALAIADEERELAWLFRWFVVNGPVLYGPHRREDVDPIWNSSVQKVRLFEEMGFPKSPIWKKGKVKAGKTKMDSAAMKWIAKNCEGAKQLVEHMLRLQCVRTNLRYLVKLRDCDGLVHPINGPAGDDDERAGAVTGRNAVKGVFPLQQMTTREEADLYQIRKAIIANESQPRTNKQPRLQVLGADAAEMQQP